MKRPLPHLLLALLLGLAPLPSLAAGLLRQPAPQVELQVIDRDSGAVLPQYRHRGQAWVPGDPGQRYAVRLRNLGAERVLVVLSVDGVNAISGQTADPRQAGYVLGPWQSLDVEGWRKSLGAVAQFVFVDPAASYAARTGRPDNVGVIGVAVFREAEGAPVAGIARAPQAAAEAERDASRAAGQAAADAAMHKEAAAPGLGTGHGAIESSPAYATHFDRQSRPTQVSQLRYDTWQALLARGIAVAPPYHRQQGWTDAPQAFPGGFVPDPPCCYPWPR